MTDGPSATKQKCELGICPDHPHTLERLAMLEKGMSTIESSMEQVVERITTVRDATMKEFTEIRKSLIQEMFKRQSPWVTIGFSLLFGTVCTLATVLLNHMLSE